MYSGNGGKQKIIVFIEFNPVCFVLIHISKNFDKPSFRIIFKHFMTLLLLG